MFQKTFDRYEGMVCFAILVAILSAGVALAVSVMWYCDWLYHAQDRWRDMRGHHNAIDFGHRYDGDGMTQWGCNRQSEGKYHCEGYMIVPSKDEPMNFSWLRASWDCDDVGCILKEAR